MGIPAPSRPPTSRFARRKLRPVLSSAGSAGLAGGGTFFLANQEVREEKNGSFGPVAAFGNGKSDASVSLESVLTRGAIQGLLGKFRRFRKQEIAQYFGCTLTGGGEYKLVSTTLADTMPPKKKTRFEGTDTTNGGDNKP